MGSTLWSTIASGLTASQFIDTPLIPNTEYYYSVRASHATGLPDTSNWSNNLFATTPLNLITLTNYHDLRRFSYTPPAQWTTATLERSLNSSFAQKTDVDSYTFILNRPPAPLSDNTTVPLTLYFYRVRFDGGAPTSYSEFAQLYTPVEPPTGLQATPNPDQERVLLTWTAPTGGVNYDIERRVRLPTPGPWETISVDLGNILYFDTSPTSGTSYEYRVYAKGTFPFSQPSRPTPVVEVDLFNSIVLWRFSWFGTIENTNDAADSADPDGGGLDNLGELLAGTDPTDPSDDTILVIDGTPPDAVHVTFELRPDYQYWPVIFSLQTDTGLNTWDSGVFVTNPDPGNPAAFRGILPTTAISKILFRLHFTEGIAN